MSVLEQIFTKEELEDIKANTLPKECFYVAENDFRDKGFVIFGAGFHTINLLLPVMKSLELFPAWIIDNNPSKHGALIQDVLIKPLSSLEEIGEKYVLLSSSYFREMYLQCLGFNVKKCLVMSSILDFCYTGGELGQCFEELLNNKQVYASYKLFSDTKSKNIYKQFCKFHLGYNLDLGNYFEPNTYFCKDLATKIDYSNFVDAGAFDGDTLKAWLNYLENTNNFGDVTYWAFEPCPPQFATLKTFALEQADRNIHVYNIALGDKIAKMPMSVSNVSSSLLFVGSNNCVEVECVTLDSLDITPSVIKADVEGFEMALLRGAEKTIRKCRPTLVISVYHKRSDLWELPLYINSLNLGYKLYLRHHLATFGDTVLYAIQE